MEQQNIVARISTFTDEITGDAGSVGEGAIHLQKKIKVNIGGLHEEAKGGRGQKLTNRKTFAKIKCAAKPQTTAHTLWHV